MRAPWLRAAIVTAIVIALDQLTKALVCSSISPGESRDVLAGIDLVHVRNDGVAFNRFAGGGPLVAIIVVVALCALLGYFATHLDKPLVWLPTGMLLGGALGNIFDRLRDGAVTDFVKLPAWPAFNVADSAITIGVIVLLVVVERSRERDGAAARS